MQGFGDLKVWRRGSGAPGWRSFRDFRSSTEGLEVAVEDFGFRGFRALGFRV